MTAVQKYGYCCLPRFSKASCQTQMRILPLPEAHNRKNAWRRSDYFCPEMIPEPDYSDDEEHEDENGGNSEKEADQEIEEVTAKHDTKRRPLAAVNAEEESKILPTKDALPKVSQEGLVVPKKPGNPYLESAEHQKLCKELKFNHKYGRSTFTPKSELQIAMDRYQEEKLRKSLEASKKTSLERILEQQAKKIELHERETVPRRPSWIDRLQEQQDDWIATDSRTSEFFRVHAKVMAHQSSESHSSSSCSQSSDASSRPSNSEERGMSRVNLVESHQKKEDSDDDQDKSGTKLNR